MVAMTKEDVAKQKENLTTGDLKVMWSGGGGPPLINNADNMREDQ